MALLAEDCKRHTCPEAAQYWQLHTYICIYLGSDVSLVTGSYGLYDRGSILGRDRDFFLFVTACRPTLGLSNQWVPGVNLTAHLHLLQKLRMRGAIPPMHHKPSWHST